MITRSTFTGAVLYIASSLYAGSAISGSISISAPDTVDSGQVVDVTVIGPTSEMQVEVWGQVTSGGIGTKLAQRPVIDGDAQVPFEFPAGSYLLRVTGPNGKVLAKAPIDISAAPIALRIEGPADPTGTIAIFWSGPGLPGDVLRVRDLGGQIHAETVADAAPNTFETRTLMDAPLETGRYEIEYVTAGGVVAQSLPLDVTESRDWLRSPLGLVVGQRFEVEWRGGLLKDHVFRMTTTDGEVLADTPLLAIDDGYAGAEFTAPDRPGRYRMEVVHLETSRVLASQPLRVGS